MLIKLNTTIPFTCYSLYLVSHAYFISTNIGIVLNYFCLCFYCFAAQRHSNLRITQYLAYFEQIWTRVVLKQTQQSLSFTQLWLRINHSKPKVVNLSNLFIFLCVFLLLWLCSNYKKKYLISFAPTAHCIRTKRQSDETPNKKDESFEQELCKAKEAGEWFRLVAGDGDNCRDVIQCTSSVSFILFRLFTFAF